jgi:translation initiation factor IF-2
MNNGKIRIYELSKELNLENRDILAYCEDFNIAVKSHSSTITEAEAAQIRSAAERGPAASSSRPSSSPAGTATKGSKSSGAAKPVKKQQILEIRRHRATAPDAPKPPESRPRPAAIDEHDSNGTNGTAASPSLKSPSRPPKAPTPPLQNSPAAEQSDEAAVEEAIAEPPKAAAPVKPVSPKPELSDRPAPKPVRPEPSIAPKPTLQAPPQLESPTAESPDVESPTAEPPDVESPVVKPPEPEPVAEVEEETPPELIKPPSRPAKPAPPSSNTSVSRPILKKNRAESSGSPAPEIIRSREELTGRPGVAASDGDVARSASSETDKPKPTLKPKPTVELRQPPRPSKPDVDVGQDTDTDSDSDIEVLEKPDLELRRPSPPRPPKRGKTRRDKDEDEEMTPRKSVSKGKRRMQPMLDDEDEDLDEALNQNDEVGTSVSLSLMRPPKPKSSSSPKPATATQRRRPTKGGSSKESSSRSNRRDRREEPKDDRPELITLTDSISVHDLADEISVPETEIIKALFFKGIAANINQILDIPTATTVAEEFGILVETAEAEAEAKKVTEMLEDGDLDNLHRRPPVVTIMGHVDHGKTTLLDSIRKTKVAQGEAGGITQHIGAYHVDVDHNDDTQQVVFLDTPGHEAFTAMRARGTRVTDIAILVVAADDGVRPQTIEAISHAKAAEVPIVVAINKIDKEGAQPDRVKQELMEHSLVPEEWGGDTIMVPVSALNGENLDTLLEMILLVSEVEDLYANPDRPARGTIIEANLDKSRGPVATLLVQNGTLRVGDTLVAGSSFCKVRAMIDDRGHRVNAASPSFAVEVLGLNDVPAAGDEFEVFPDEKEARAIADNRKDEQRRSRLQQAMASRRVSLNTLSLQAQEGELKELNLVLKADVQGSVEAILGSLQQLPQKEVQLRVLLAAPGEITETDVDLAAASDAVIIGFNTTLATGARPAADDAGVDVREYNIIYKLLEDIQGAMEGLLDPEMVEEPLGQLEVRAVFPVGKGAVAGCYVQSGKAVRNCRVRIRRGNEVIHEGNLDSLKRVKDDVKEANAGYECGIGLGHFNSWQEGDIIETFKMVSKRRTLTV